MASTRVVSGLGRAYGGWLSRRYLDRSSVGAINFEGGVFPVRIQLGPGARFVIRGSLTFEPWAAGLSPTTISLAGGSTLEIDGDLRIGDGNRIALADGARLRLGGRRTESAAGITSRSVLLVHREVTIGHDCLVGFDTVITDSDWHALEGQEPTQPVEIGDHVWIGSRVTVLKGTTIARDSVVGAGAVVAGGKHPERSLLLGVPARAAGRPAPPWSRDIA